MANQKDITLNQGHAAPKNITLRDLPAAPVSTGTAIYLYEGASSAKDILLSNPAVVREAGGGAGAALSGASTLTFTNAGNLTGASALSASSSLTFSTAGELKGAAALSGTTTLTFATAGDALAVAALSGTSGLTFTTAGDLVGNLAASGASSLTFTTAGDLRGALSMSGTTTATFATAGDLTGSSALAGTTTVTFTPSADLSIAGGGGADLSGSTGLTFTVSGTADITIAAAPNVRPGGGFYIYREHRHKIGSARVTTTAKKKARKAIVAAAEVIAEADTSGELLDAIARLDARIAALQEAQTQADVIAQTGMVEELTAILARMIEEDDEESFLLLAA